MTKESAIIIQCASRKYLARKMYNIKRREKREKELFGHIVSRLPDAKESIQNHFRLFADITQLLSVHLPETYFEDIELVQSLRKRVIDILRNIHVHQQEQNTKAYRFDIHAFEQLHAQFETKITDLLVHYANANHMDDILGKMEELKRTTMDLTCTFKTDMRLLMECLKHNRHRIDRGFNDAREHYENVYEFQNEARQFHTRSYDFQNEARYYHNHFAVQHQQTHDKIDSVQRVIGFTTMVKFGYEVCKFGLCVAEAILES